MIGLDDAAIRGVLRDLGVLGRRRVRVMALSVPSWIAYTEAHGIPTLGTFGSTRWEGDVLEVALSPLQSVEMANDTLLHELKHVQQFAGYASEREAMEEYNVWLSRVGYDAHPMELSAERFARRVRNRYTLTYWKEHA